MKEHNLIWSNNKTIFNVITDNIVWKQKANILYVNYRIYYTISSPFPNVKTKFFT